MKLKYFFILFVILGLSVYLLIPQPIEVEAATIHRGKLEIYIEEDGKTRVKNRFTISSPLSGHLLRMEWRSGDTVKTGDPLFQLRPQAPGLLDSRARAQAEAAVQAEKANLERAQKIIHQAESEWDLSKTNLQQAQKLFEVQQLSKFAHTRASQRERIQRHARDEAYQSFKVADFRLKQAQAALLTLSRNPSSDPFQVHAPLEGQVFKVYRESAGFIGAGEPLLELGNPSHLEVVVDLLSKDAAQVKPDAPVLLEHWGGEQPLRGRTRLVEPSGFTKLSALGVEEQRVNVIIDLVEESQSYSSLGDGFRVEARIQIWQAADLLLVPTSALFHDQNEWTVYLHENGKARKVPIRIGKRNSVSAQVLSGLQENDTVILYPGDHIRDGVRVQVQKKPS